MKTTLCGRTMQEAREEFLRWLNGNINYDEIVDTQWKNHCMRYWLNELGGLGGAW